MSSTAAQRVCQSGRKEDRTEFMHRWGLVVQGDDKRTHERVPLKCEVCLIDAQGQTVLRCCSNNVSDGGLHAILSAKCGLAVGQRYEVRLALFDAVQKQAEAITEAHQATVVRTEVLMAEEEVKLGVGLRFDQPSRLPRPSC